MKSVKAFKTPKCSKLQSIQNTTFTELSTQSGVISLDDFCITNLPDEQVNTTPLPKQMWSLPWQIATQGAAHICKCRSVRSTRETAATSSDFNNSDRLTDRGHDAKSASLRPARSTHVLLPASRTTATQQLCAGANSAFFPAELGGAPSEFANTAIWA
jgi:hypothetical protein